MCTCVWCLAHATHSVSVLLEVHVYACAQDASVLRGSSTLNTHVVSYVLDGTYRNWPGAKHIWADDCRALNNSYRWGNYPDTSIISYRYEFEREIENTKKSTERVNSRKAQYCTRYEHRKIEYDNVYHSISAVSCRIFVLAHQHGAPTEPAAC